MAEETPRSALLAELDAAPEWAVFDERYAAAARNVTVFTIQLDRTKNRGIPFERIGRRCLYRKSTILAYLEGKVRLGAPQAIPVLLEAA